MSSKELSQALSYFRKLQFFSQYGNLPDEVVADELEERYGKEWGRAFHPSDELADLLLLRYDQQRVWWEDREADVFMGNNVYVDTLQQWSKISRGAFLPQDMMEAWESEEGPISINFTLDGVHRRITAQYLNDFIDIEIVPSLNNLISDTDYRFEVYQWSPSMDSDQSAFLVALTSDEKQRLERERGWRFMS